MNLFQFEAVKGDTEKVVETLSNMQEILNKNK